MRIQKKAESMALQKDSIDKYRLYDVEEVKLSKRHDTDDEEDMDDISEYHSPRVDMSSTGAT